MQTKAILQTVGTISSLILAFITLHITHNIFEIDLLNIKDILWKYTEFILGVLTVILMVVTGLSYYNTRLEHEGTPRYLYVLLGMAHVAIAPLALVVGTMKAEFGQYWIAAGILLILLLIYMGTRQRESHN